MLWINTSYEIIMDSSKGKEGMMNTEWKMQLKNEKQSYSIQSKFLISVLIVT